MIYIYASRPSTGAKDLIEEINRQGGQARRLRDRRGLRLRRGLFRALRPGDMVVNWGETIGPVPAGVRVINPRLVHNKLRELQIMQQQGVRTVPFVAGPRPGEARAYGDAVGVWLGRNANHMGGHDLLAGGSRNPAFYVQRLDIVKEFRVHILSGVSIRAGMKVPRDGFRDGEANAARRHPWVRSWDGGWKISYGEGNGAVRQKHREAARMALMALHMNFGAVDLGETRDGSVVVFEVNSAPGNEGGTTQAYARKFIELERTIPREERAA